MLKFLKLKFLQGFLNQVFQDLNFFGNPVQKNQFFMVLQESQDSDVFRASNKILKFCLKQKLCQSMQGNLNVLSIDKKLTSLKMVV